ncbi:MAG: hypothetical protein IJ795_04655 [Bacteroidales bacterium]|nr:hypothetical protein [Bacteroidales bacterium]
MRFKLLIITILIASSCAREEAVYVGYLPPAVVTDSGMSADSAFVAEGNAALGAETSLDMIEQMRSWQEEEMLRLYNEARIRELRLWVLIGFLLAIIVSVVWYFITRKVLQEKQLQEERAENERLMNIAEDLQGKLTSSRDRNRDNALLERLCEQYYIYDGTSNLQPKILREVRQVIEEMRSNPAELEKSVNEATDGAVTALRQALPKLKEDDIQLYCYLASGFSTTTISTLMEKDKQYIYNRVYRLRGRISETPQKDRLLAWIKG